MSASRKKNGSMPLAVLLEVRAPPGRQWCKCAAEHNQRRLASANGLALPAGSSEDSSTVLH
jgi:hypothetical protein